MTLPTCTVTVTLADPAPVAGAIVTATLTAREVYQGLVVPASRFATTDAAGQCTLDLWPNVLGTLGAHYVVRIDRGRAYPLETLHASVPNATTANLHELLIDEATGLPVTAPVRSFNARRGDVTLQLSDVTTVGGATAASVTAEAARAMAAEAAVWAGVVRIFDAIVGAADTGLTDGAVVYARGRSAAGDGGGGLFRYSATSTQASDLVLVFSASDGSGRYFREGWTVLGFNGPLQPEWAGAQGGGADDTAALQRAYNAINAMGGGALALSRQYTSGALTVYANTLTLATQPGAGFKLLAGSDARLLVMSGSARQNIWFDDLLIDGNAANVTGTQALATVYLARDFGFRRLVLQDVKRLGLNISQVVGYFEVTDGEFRRIGGAPDGSSGYRSQAVAISNTVAGVSRKFLVARNDFEDIGLDAISIDQASHGRIAENTSERSGGAVVYTTGMPGSENRGLVIVDNIGQGHGAALGVSPEPNGLDFTYLTDSTVNGNVMFDFGGCGIGFFRGCSGISFNGNTANNNACAPLSTWKAGFVIGAAEPGEVVSHITGVGNTATDTRADGSKTQDYGFQLGTDTLAHLTLGVNNTHGNAVADYGAFTSAAPGTVTPITDWTSTPATWSVLLTRLGSGTFAFGRALGLADYDKAALPSPASVGAALCVVNDDAGGPCLAWCDGTTWRRSVDNAAIS